MAIIGSFGNLIFEVSENKTQTYADFQRTTSPRWEQHKVYLHKPVPEFEGPGADTISFKIIFRAEFGVHPEKAMAALREFARRGKKALFVRGNKPISINYWVIDKIVERHKQIDNMGNVLSIEADIDLLEYPKRPADTSEKKTVAAVKSSNQSASKKRLGTMKITVKSVHIRSGPGVNYKVLGYAMRNDELTVYSEKNGWYSLGGGKYITASAAYSTLKKG